jgi:glycosyltransferase involved in cell wall biosynthesis
MMQPRYSICITTYQAGKTIKSCLESVLSQLDSRFEVVIVDSESTDGTLEYLLGLARGGQISLMVRKCNRGEGRQLAVQQAKGQVLIQQVDADQRYRTFFKEAADKYEIQAARNPETVVIFNCTRPIRMIEQAPSKASFVRKDAFIKRTSWPPLDYGEDQHVFDELKVVRLEAGDYVEQMKGGILRVLLGAISNMKQFMDSGFSFVYVVKKTRHHGILFVARALVVCAAWVWHKADSRLGS